jgi:esterase/lipase superfamily enzyme
LRGKRWGAPFLCIALALLGGCSTTRSLMPVPNIYAAGDERAFEDVAPENRAPSTELIYVTDRKAEENESDTLAYGYERSSSTAFGRVSVEFGAGYTWERLVEQSLRRERDQPISLRLGRLEEIGRFPATPLPFAVRDGLIEVEAEEAAVVREQARRLDALVNRRLARSSSKHVLLYVHGYNNTFADATFTLAEIWHFFGREGVPIVYTWPAGRGGLRGYTYDRESGEFTAYHLKQLIRRLSANEAVEQIRILAHSRGTDITVTALRELFIEARAAGVNPLERYRIASLVLAAPDLDFSVIQQRVMTEPIGPGVGQLTIYVSQGDRAIGLAEWLFGGLTRLGRLQFVDLRAPHIEVMKSVGRIDIVDLRGEGGAFGHGYFHANPAASSDLILAMRYGRKAGKENGRPLKQIGGSFWAIEEGYPFVERGSR